MTADELKAQYAQDLKEAVVVRRYTGLGSNRPKFEVTVRGKSWGYAPKELVGAIQQGDTRVLLLVDDLITKGMALPLTASDKLLVEGRAGVELAIIAPRLRKAEDGTPVAYDIQSRG